MVAVWTFIIALAVSLLSGAALVYLPVIPALVLIVFIVLLGIAFDIIGLAAATATEAPFHARAAKRSLAARQAVTIVRNAEFVSSLCNDLVGDVCGTVSGAAVAAIVFRLATVRPGWDAGLTSVLAVAAIAALTVGGKAAGKGYALDRSNDIIYRVAVVLAGWRGLILRLRGAVQTRPQRLSGNKSGTKGGRPGGQQPGR
jgi:CBS domain containing-hemolysin-like protein